MYTICIQYVYNIIIHTLYTHYTHYTYIMLTLCLHYTYIILTLYLHYTYIYLHYTYTLYLHYTYIVYNYIYNYICIYLHYTYMTWHYMTLHYITLHYMYIYMKYLNGSSWHKQTYTHTHIGLVGPGPSNLGKQRIWTRPLPGSISERIGADAQSRERSWFSSTRDIPCLDAHTRHTLSNRKWFEILVINIHKMFINHVNPSDQR